MNYRHAFHAGNFADCFKHALLAWCVRAMQRKEKPLFLLDTHAGIGRYDLAADEPSRTGEWLAGIFRLRADPAPPLADYLALADALGPNAYPGSPELMCMLARPGDRVALVEKHPQDAALLRARYRGRAQVHERCGYQALRALLPPPERRALVLVDPPFEAPDEFDRLAEALVAGHGRFAPAVLLGWYPVKGRAPARALHDRLRAAGVPDVVAAELMLRPEPLDAARLNGCGLVVVNPPFGFEDAARDMLAALAAQLAPELAPQGGWTLMRIADE